MAPIGKQIYDSRILGVSEMLRMVYNGTKLRNGSVSMKEKSNDDPKILLINDMAGYGKVALPAMIPVFSHFKLETFNLPTALVSNTLDYGLFEILDTTEYMRNTLKIWKKLSFDFDAVCTGFIASEQQASLVCEFCKEQREKGSRIFVDPIMGDDGKLYNGVTEESVISMKQLCAAADVVVPNITEACFLSDHEVQEFYTEEEINQIANQLHDLGAKAVVITSIKTKEGKYTAVKASPEASIRFLPYEEIPVRFPGTGDVFLSIMVGYYLRNGALEKSVETAMRQLESIIRANQGNQDKYKGIPIEQFLEDISNEET